MCIRQWLMSLAFAALLLVSGGPAAQACRIIVPPPPHRPTPDPAREPLRTRRHHATITVEGRTATVAVEAVFHNPNPETLEGTYFFPLPADVAVREFTMTVNGHELKGELLDAERARGVYEDIVRQMKDPALLEYVGMQMLKCRVYPIGPDSDVTVRLTYAHLVPIDGGLHRLEYPLGSARPAGEGTTVDEVVVTTTLHAERPLATVYSPSHPVDVNREEGRTALAGYEAKDVRPEQDLLLYWSTTDEAVGADLLTVPGTGGESGTFLLAVTPSQEAMEAPAMPKDIVFVLDKSGSMREDGKMGQARNALKHCLKSLAPEDRFGIVLFSTATDRFASELKKATEENVEAAVAWVDAIEAGGGTAIDMALRSALGLLEADGAGLPMCLFLTDGLPTVGLQNPEQILNQAKQANEADSRLFVFGVGYDVNVKLLDRLAEEGRGVREYVQPEENIEEKVSALYGKIDSPVLADVSVNYDGARVRETYPQRVPDLFRGGQVTILGRYDGTGGGTVTLAGRIGKEERSFTYDVGWGERRGPAFLPALWARRKVGYLLDQIRLHGENAELVDEVRRLGKRYGIVTPYTSYLIVEEGMSLSGRERREADETVRSLREAAARDFAEGGDVGEKAQARSKAVGGLGGGSFGAGPALEPASPTESEEENEALTPAEEILVGGRRRRLGRQAIQQFRDKTFVQYGETWIDTDAGGEDADADVAVAFLSEEYFALLEKVPGIAPYLSVGAEVVVKHGGTVYKVTQGESD
jgi:Ca-activated chloride channel family protein